MNCIFFHLTSLTCILDVRLENLVVNDVGLFLVIRCHVCTNIEKKEKVLITNWDSIKKHVYIVQGFDHGSKMYTCKK